MKTLERIKAPPPDVFWNEYVLKRKPVVITNLYEGQPIREINTLEAAIAKFGDGMLSVREEYMSAFLKGAGSGGSQLKPMTMRDYLDFAAANPGTSLMSTEDVIPASVRSLYEVHPYCKYAPNDAASFIFVGNRGNHGHMHFDFQPTHNLFYQIAGRKRLFLVDPDSSIKLVPVLNVSSFLLENFGERDKIAFLEYVDGYDVTLEPGEGVYMPMFIWHHIEYTDTGISLSHRFALNQRAKWLVAHLHRDIFVQGIGAALTDEQEAEKRFAAELEEIESAYKRFRGTPFGMYKHMQEVVRRVHRTMCPNALTAMYNFFPEQIQDHLVRAMLDARTDARVPTV